MKNLANLMREFAILGMEPAPIEGENGLDFPPVDDATAPVEEYELDADGNPVLDANGNPVKKVPAAIAAAPTEPCTCDTTPLATPVDPALAPAGIAPAQAALPPPPPEDEFDFNF